MASGGSCGASCHGAKAVVVGKQPLAGGLVRLMTVSVRLVRVGALVVGMKTQLLVSCFNHLKKRNKDEKTCTPALCQQEAL